MDHRTAEPIARDACEAVCADRGLPVPTDRVVAMVMAVAAHESGYGASRATNNWGMVQCTQHGGQAADGHCVDFEDSHEDGTKYHWSYRIYDTPADGAVAMTRLLLRDIADWKAFDSGDAFRACAKMRDRGYFEAPLKVYASDVQKLYSSICKATGVPASDRAPDAGGTSVASAGVGILAVVAIWIVLKGRS